MSEVIGNIKRLKFTTIEQWTIVLLTLLSFTGVSVAQIGKAMLTPFHLIMGLLIAYGMMTSRKGSVKFSFSLLIFMLYVLLVNVLQYPAIRYTSVLYTLIYGLEVTILFNFMKRCRQETMLAAFRLIINLYFINLFLGFVLVTLGIRFGPLEQIIRVYYAEGGGGGRPMGFSSEPSYAAFMLAVVLLSYLHLTKHLINKASVKLVAKVVLCILFSKSAYGFLFIGVILLDWIFVIYKRGGVVVKNVLPLLFGVGLIGLGVLSTQIENEAFQRIHTFTTVAIDNSYTGKRKLQKLQAADGSAFARIGPTYLLITQTGDEGFNRVIGEGAGSAGTFLAKFLEGLLVDEGRTSVDTGIIPALIFDYGCIGGILFLVFLICVFRRLPFAFWLLFFLILPNANINTQLIWFAVACFMFVNISLPKKIAFKSFVQSSQK